MKTKSILLLSTFLMLSCVYFTIYDSKSKRRIVSKLASQMPTGTIASSSSIESMDGTNHDFANNMNVAWYAHEIGNSDDTLYFLKAMFHNKVDEKPDYSIETIKMMKGYFTDALETKESELKKLKKYVDKASIIVHFKHN